MAQRAAPYSSGSVALILLVAPFLRAQTPVTRAEAREVLIDVTVTGKNGTSVSDLTAKDFLVWEDGKAQKITGVTTAAADSVTAQKHFVIYFDFTTLRFSDQSESEKRAREFVESLASPDRYMSVVLLGASGSRVIQDFTNAKGALLKAVEAPLNSQVQAARIFPGNPQVSGGQLVDSLSKVCESIAPAAGRKAVLLFTGTAPLNYDPFKTMTGVCNRANVALYPITANAASPIAASDNSRMQMTPGFGPPAAGQPQPAANFAGFLAENTGGQALILTESLPQQLAAIARQQDEYYRVAYTPPAAKEGSCHTLRVATNVRGLATKARNEYCTEKQVDLVAGRIAGQGLESRAAAGVAGNLTATMQLPYFYTGTNRVSVHLSVELVPAGMKFDKDKGGLHGQIDLVGTAIRQDGGTAARFADTVNIDQPDQQHADAFTRVPYHYEHQFTMAAGTYKFQLAIGAGPNSAAKAELPLIIDPWNSATLGVSAIAMSRGPRPADDLISSSGGPMLEGRGPLVAAGARFDPVASNRFARSEQIYFYVEVYDPALATDGSPPPFTMQYRILEPKTGGVIQDSGVGSMANFVRAGNSIVPFATRLPTSDLPAGTYRLEVRAAKSSAEGPVIRSLDFELY